MLHKLVQANLVHFEDSFESWEEAIRASYRMMLAQNIVEDTYVEQVIASVKEHGPYIVLLPNVAMPHASQGAEGVNKSAIAFMKVEKPVEFAPGDSEKDAQLFFALAALDSNQHLNNITQLSELLMNEEVVQALKDVKSIEDVLAVAKKYNLS